MSELAEPKLYQMLGHRLKLKNLLRHLIDTSPKFYGDQKVHSFTQFLTTFIFVLRLFQIVTIYLKSKTNLSGKDDRHTSSLN